MKYQLFHRRIRKQGRGIRPSNEGLDLLDFVGIFELRFGGKTQRKEKIVRGRLRPQSDEIYPRTLRKQANA